MVRSWVTVDVTKTDGLVADPGKCYIPYRAKGGRRGKEYIEVVPGRSDINLGGTEDEALLM